MPDTALPAAKLPIRVPLATEPLGVLGSWQAARENTLGIIPEIATHQPIVSGSTVRRWHMVMDPPAIRRILIEALEIYPKSVVTKNLLRPAIGDSLFILSPRVNIGVCSGALRRLSFCIGTCRPWHQS